MVSGENTCCKQKPEKICWIRKLTLFLFQPRDFYSNEKCNIEIQYTNDTYIYTTDLLAEYRT